MEITQNSRWQQRFQNFEGSFKLLKNALEIENPDVTQRAGIIQFFEISFELGWKLMKDYLEEQGFTEIKSPRDAIKKSFETEIILDGELWLKALVDRNLTTQIYEEKTAMIIDSLIRRDYFRLLENLYETMRKKL